MSKATDAYHGGHEDARNEFALRRASANPITRAQAAFASRLTRVNDERVRCGQSVPALQDPSDVLGLIEAHARNARLCGGLVDSFDVIGALAIAGRMSRERADEASPFTGGDHAA